VRVFVGALFLAAAVWLVWVPVSEYRHAVAAGTPRLPFSRMLLRLVVAGCVCLIGLALLLSALLLPGRPPLFELLYWMGTVLLGFVMFLAGLTEYLLVKRDLLLGQRDILRDLGRPRRHAEDGGE
jgi:hypothetical protein